MSLRLATLNIWNRMGPWEERLESIRHGVEQLAADVLGLQEVVQIGTGADRFDQAHLVAEGLGYHVCTSLHPETDHPMGNAVLSRWPIRRHAQRELPSVHTDERRTLLYAEINAPFGVLPIFCTHLNWRPHEANVRRAQIEFVVDQIEAMTPSGAFPAVLLGDLNAEPDADEIRFLRGLTILGGKSVYFADAFGIAGDGSPGTTFSRDNTFARALREPNRRIDYIFVHGPDEHGRGEPLSAEVCFRDPWNGVLPSDHYGVVATISTE